MNRSRGSSRNTRSRGRGGRPRGQRRNSRGSPAARNPVPNNARPSETRPNSTASQVPQWPLPSFPQGAYPRAQPAGGQIFYNPYLLPQVTPFYNPFFLPRAAPYYNPYLLPQATPWPVVQRRVEASHADTRGEVSAPEATAVPAAPPASPSTISPHASPVASPTIPPAAPPAASPAALPIAAPFPIRPRSAPPTFPPNSSPAALTTAQSIAPVTVPPTDRAQEALPAQNVPPKTSNEPPRNPYSRPPDIKRLVPCCSLQNCASFSKPFIDNTRYDKLAPRYLCPVCVEPQYARFQWTVWMCLDCKTTNFYRDFWCCNCRTKIADGKGCIWGMGLAKQQALYVEWWMADDGVWHLPEGYWKLTKNIWNWGESGPKGWGRKRELDEGRKEWMGDYDGDLLGMEWWPEPEQWYR